VSGKENGIVNVATPLHDDHMSDRLKEMLRVVCSSLLLAGACAGSAGCTAFGQPPRGEGYHFRLSGTPGSSYELTVQWEDVSIERVGSATAASTEVVVVNQERFEGTILKMTRDSTLVLELDGCWRNGPVLKTRIHLEPGIDGASLAINSEGLSVQEFCKP